MRKVFDRQTYVRAIGEKNGIELQFLNTYPIKRKKKLQLK